MIGHHVLCSCLFVDAKQFVLAVLSILVVVNAKILSRWKMSFTTPLLRMYFVIFQQQQQQQQRSA